MTGPRQAGPSIHIGVNHVDAAKYPIHVPVLSGCLNDAGAMRDVAAQRGYGTTLLTDSEATAANVLDALASGVSRLSPGQTMLVTYAGHGSQVIDTSQDDINDLLDETWVLYDRQLIDDEINAVLSPAPAGSRILVVSDSCHSGTVTRDLMDPPVPYRAPMMPSVVLAYGDVGRAVSDAMTREAFADPVGAMTTAWPQLRQTVVAKAADALDDQWAEAAGVDVSRKSRKLNPSLAQRDLDLRPDTYRPYLSLAAGAQPTQAAILLLSACADNQTALDGKQNGLFTEELLGVLRDGLAHDYPSFMTEIARRVNQPNHLPSLFWSTAPDPDFERSEPLAP
jgi:hypothetical protein